MAFTTSTPLVEAHALQKDYGATRAVQDVSFRVFRGEVVGFLGPNGAGKTTTMKMLTGFLKPTAGQAFISGINVAIDPIGAQRLLGYLPENAPLYDDMMVLDFLLYAAELRGMRHEESRARLRDVCSRCGLLDVLGKDIGQLSKGYRQRVGLAQALVHDPDLLILDEPTSGLDPNQIVEIRALIRDLGRDKTVILSTHILPEVQATCGRIIIINDGRLVADDTPDALTGDNTLGSMIRLVVRDRNRHMESISVEHIRAIFLQAAGVRSVDVVDGEGAGTFGFALRTQNDAREAIFNAAVENNVVILDMHRERVSLEDTFRRLTHAHSVAQNAGERYAYQQAN